MSKQTQGSFIWIFSVILLLGLATTACAPNIERLQKQEDVGGLIDALEYERDPEIRAAAALALGELDEDQAVDPLKALLEDPEPSVRIAAATALGQIGKTSSINALIGCFSDSNSEVRAAGSEALALIGDPAVGPLLHYLDMNSDNYASEAVDALAGIGRPAIPELFAALTNENEALQEVASQALVQMGAPVVPLLLDELSTSTGSFYEMLEDVLVEMGSESVYELIASLNGKSYQKAEIASSVLIKIGKPAVQPLIYSLVDNNRQKEVMDILTEIGEPAIVPLIEALSDPDLEIPAGDVLVAVGPDGINALLDAYEEEPDNVDVLVRPIIYGLMIQDEATQERVSDLLIELGESSVPAIVSVYRDLIKVVTSTTVYDAHHATMSALGSAEGILVDGGLCTEPGNWYGMIVVCERGENYFYEKALNVQTGGGVGVILYNNVEGYLFPTVEGDEEIVIVVVALTNAQGEELVDKEVGEYVSITSEDISAFQGVLVGMGSKIIPQMIDLLGDEQMTTLAQGVLIDLGPSSVSALLELYDTSAEVDLKTTALYILGEIDDDRVINPLIDALDDPDASIRLWAVRALESQNDPVSVEPLVNVLGDTSEDVRNAAKGALETLGMPAVDALMTVYHEDDGSEKDLAGDILYSIFVDNSAEIESIAAGVCEGNAVEAAAGYSRNEGDFHPMFIVSSEGGTHIWNNLLPADWLVFYPEQLELVLCLGGGDMEVVEVCQYYYTGSGAAAPSITRYRRTEVLKLFAARSGALLGTTTLRGDTPDNCPYQTSASTTSITGNYVTVAQYKDWLSLYGIPFNE